MKIWINRRGCIISLREYPGLMVFLFQNPCLFFFFFFTTLCCILSATISIWKPSNWFQTVSMYTGIFVSNELGKKGWWVKKHYSPLREIDKTAILIDFLCQIFLRANISNRNSDTHPKPPQWKHRML